MKINKLNVRGFSHHFVMVLVILIVAIGGTAYLVASHADTCSGSATSGPTSEPTSGATSDPNGSNCDNTSGATSDPGTPPAASLSANCSISGVPSNPTYGQVLNPSVSITNTGNKAFSTTINFSIGTGDGQGHGKGAAPTYDIPTIQPGGSYTQALTSYTVAYADSATTVGGYTVDNTTPPFNCKADFKLPAKPATPPAPTYSLTCKVTGLPKTALPGDSLVASITLTNTGTAALDNPIPTVNWSFNSANSPKPSVYAPTSYTGTIAPGDSKVVKAYLSITDDGYWSKATLATNTAYRDSTGAKTLPCNTIVVSKTAIPKIVLNSKSWKSFYRASVVTDGKYGSVVKITKGGASSIFTNVNGNNYKAKQTPLPELVRFAKSNLGKAVVVCVQARFDKAVSAKDGTNRTIFVAVGGMFTGSGTSNGEVDKRNVLSTSYTHQCYTVRMQAKVQVGSSSTEYASAWIDNSSAVANAYIQGLSITAK